MAANLRLTGKTVAPFFKSASSVSQALTPDSTSHRRDHPLQGNKTNSDLDATVRLLLKP